MLLAERKAFNIDIGDKKGEQGHPKESVKTLRTSLGARDPFHLPHLEIGKGS